MPDDTVFVKCDCGGHAIQADLYIDKVLPEDWSDICLSIWYMSCYASQPFFRRLKNLFKYFIQGHRAVLEDIVLTKESALELGQTLVRMAQTIEEHEKRLSDERRGTS